jgi:hypothetical protein
LRDCFHLLTSNSIKYIIAFIALILLLAFAIVRAGRKHVRGLRTATAVLESLSKVPLPDLPRPPGPDTNPNEELVYWGIKVYSYAMVANLRELLRGVLLLNDERDAVGVYGLARQMLEWTAHGCYVSRNLKNYVTRSEWQRAWNWLTRSIIGNLYMRQNASEIQQEFGMKIPKMPEPLALPALISAYDKYQLQIYGKADAQQDYEFMSEFTHPNGVALHTYYEWKNDGRILSFDPPPVISPASFINRCLVDVLQFIHDLLTICKEETVRPALVSSLRAMITASKQAGIARKE